MVQMEMKGEGMILRAKTSTWSHNTSYRAICHLKLLLEIVKGAHFTVPSELPTTKQMK